MNLSNRKIILHIDDDEDDREIVREAISRIEPQAILRQVNDGDQGLLFLRQAKLYNDLPCLIILDINLPGKNGKEVLMEIKKDKELASLPLVLLTTSSSQLDKLFARKHHVELVTKPHRYEVVNEVIKNLLERCANHQTEIGDKRNV